MRKCSLLLFVLTACCVHAQVDTDSLKQALRVAREDTTKAMVLLKLSNAYTYSSPDTAIAYANEALKLSERLDYPMGLASAQYALSRAFATQGDYPQALDHGLKAIPFCEQTGQPIMIAYGLMNIALAYRDMEDYPNSLKYIRRTLSLATPSSIPEYHRATFWGVASSIFEKLDKVDSSIYYGAMALKVQSGYQGVLYVMGSAYSKKKEYATAMDYYQRALRLAEKGLIGIVFLDVYNGMATLFDSKGEVDSALFYARKVVQLEWARAFPASVLQAATTLASLYQRENRMDSAVKYLNLTIALKDSLFSQEKTRAVQNLAFHEQQRMQEAVAQEQRYKSRLQLIVVMGISFTLLVVALLLWRNIRHRQKSFAMVQQQKQETEKAYQQLKATQHQLIQREKMASLGELTAGIAHEIQNPLNFVNNFSELNGELLEEAKVALRAGNLPAAEEALEEAKQNAHKVHHHGKRADLIVRGMLEHSRPSTGERRAVNVNMLTEEYLKLAHNAYIAKRGSFNIVLQTHFDQAMGKVNMLPQEIGRVLVNLFNNAFYAVHQKKLQLNGSFEPVIKVSTRKDGNNVLISIKDNGTGMSPNVAEKVFQPFFTTKATGEGTGLGLSLSYDIITKGHSGELKGNTREGEYTEFTIQIPAAEITY